MGQTWLQRFIKTTNLIEDSCLVLLLTSMLALAVSQIVLRNFFDGGIFWGDAALRVMLLWVAMFGAMVASRNGAHINIDVVTRFVPRRYQLLMGMVTALFTAVICGLLAYHSYRFVVFEYQDGFVAFANMPNWVNELVLPIGFGVIALRFLGLVWLRLNGKDPADNVDSP